MATVSKQEDKAGRQYTYHHQVIIRQCPCTALVQIRHHHLATLKINLQRNKDKYDPIVQEILELYLQTALTDPDGFQI